MSDLKAIEYKSFEAIKHLSDDGDEYWYARELATVLEYVQWRNFQKVLDRAILACKNSGYEIIDHFAEVSKIVEAGATSKPIVDFMSSTELIANLFRISQTEEKLKKDKASTADAANEIHFIVGREVRGTIERVGGTMPEDLPVPKKSISDVEREQLKKLKKNPNKLMLDE